MKFPWLLLGALALPAWADPGDVLVGYVCNGSKDELLLTYDRVRPEPGKSKPARKRATQWDPWSLVVMQDRDTIGSVKSIRRSCTLSDGVYRIEITASPGNYQIQGRCGAAVTAGAKVWKGASLAYELAGFEGDCMDLDKPIVTRVRIAPGKPAEVSTVDFNAFYE